MNVSLGLFRQYLKVSEKFSENCPELVTVFLIPNVEFPVIQVVTDTFEQN